MDLDLVNRPEMQPAMRLLDREQHHRIAVVVGAILQTARLRRDQRTTAAPGGPALRARPGGAGQIAHLLLGALTEAAMKAALAR